MWRYRELMPLFDGEAPVTLGEGWTPLIHARRLGADARPRRGSSSRTNRSTRPTRSRRAGCPPRSRARAHLGATTLVGAVGGQRRQRDGRLRGRAPASRRRSSCRGTSRSPFIRECELYGADVTLVDGLITDAGRIAAETRQAARLVRRVDAQGAVPHRRQEDDGLRARRAARTGSCPTGSSIRPAAAPAWSACGRRSRRSSASAGWRPAGGRGWCRCRRSTARRSCAPSSRAPSAPSCGRTRARSPTACACRRRSATSWSCARCARAAAPRSRCPTPTWSTACASSARREGISAAPEGGAALQALKRLVADGQVEADDTVVLFNTGGALKYLDVLS